MQKAFVGIEDYLNSKYLEREEVIRGMLLASLTRQHIFLYGPPGTGKTEMLKDFCESIENADFFDWLMMKGTRPDELFGPYNPQGIREGKFHRVTDERLPRAHIALLDEIWKSSSGIINSLLRIMDNTRTFEGQRCPLIFACAASNEFPEDESLTAAYERFCLRYVVEDVKSEASKREILWGGKKRSEKITITLTDLMKAQIEVTKVTLSEDLKEACMTILRELENKNVRVDMRKNNWVVSHKGLSLVKASAWLDGRSVANAEDLRVYCDVAWAEKGQISSVSRIVRAHAQPRIGKLQAYLDKLVETVGLLESNPSPRENQVSELLERSNALKVDIENEIKAGGSRQRAQQLKKMLKDVRPIIANLARRAVGNYGPGGA